MAVTEENVFSFDLNESLYFKKGQEIAELRGIELEPSLAIEPKDSYVDVRGVFELRGEYRKVESEPADSEYLEQPNALYNEINQIDDTTDDEAVFIHEFPVDISIPIERINDEKDIRITVKTFDYELPLNNLLKISAQIEIHGISQASTNDSLEKTALEQLRELSDTESDDYEDSTELDDKSTEDTFEVPETQTEARLDEQEIEQIEMPMHVYKEDENEDSNVEHLEETSLPEKEINITDMFEPEETVAKNDHNEEIQSQDGVSNVIEETNEQEEPVEQEILETEIDTEEVESAETKAEMGVHNLEEEPVENTLSLLFSGGDEENFASMRLYIVQENDSLESIAERYNVPITKILQHNRLDSENIGEGQLVYIPRVKTND